MIRVIQAIQKAKSAQTSYSELSRNERADLLRRLRQQIEISTDSIVLWDQPHIGESSDFLREHSVRASLLRFDEAVVELESENAPSVVFSGTGLISIILPSVLSFRVMCERLAPALAAGNVVLVKISSRSPDWSQEFHEMLKRAGFSDGVCQLIYGAGSDVGSLMATHPAVRAVSFAGRFETAEGILQQPSLLQKKIQFSKSGNNSAILVGDSWTDQQVELLAESCFRGGGRLPWNTTKIFVPEAASQSFVERFTVVTKELFTKSVLPAVSERHQKSVASAISDGARRLVDEPTVLIDLSHCSVLQQDEMASPLVLVSRVKYLHEAVKWANTGYLGMSALILGPEEKALRVAQKLECGRVWLNSWICPENGVIVGVKQSMTGDNDFGVFGSFYSDRKIIVGASSK